MIIERDYSYISSSENKLIDAGYGKVTVYSLHFNRYVSEEQKEINRKFFESMTETERNNYYKSAQFESVQEAFSKSLQDVLDIFIGKFDIHQVSEETSTSTHYNSNWDLFFWSDRGWNGKEYMSRFTLSFNENRTPEQNMELLDKIIALLESMENEKVYCRIQYDAHIDMKRVAVAARKIYDGIAGKFVEMFCHIGKVKIVSEDSEGVKYGFFKKGASKRYYALSAADLLTMNL